MFQGIPVTDPPSTKENLPPPNINVTVDTHKWEIISSNHTTTNNTTITNTTSLPRFDEFEKLGSLLPEEDGLSCEDILSQFAPIEDTFDNLKLSLDRPRKHEVATSPPPALDPEPVFIEVRDVPCKHSAPLPKPNIDINKSIDDYNKKNELPIKLDPEEIANSPLNRKKDPEPPTPVIELDTAPVVKALKPFGADPLFDEPVKQETTLDDPAANPPLETILNDPALTTPKETTIDDPAPKKKRKKKKKKPAPPPEPEPEPEPKPVVEPEPEPVPEPEPEPEPVVEVEEAKPVQASRPRSPSPTPSFRRRRASMESAKDFSILGKYTFTTFSLS